MDLYRLEPHDPASHRYWPQFENRVRRFSERFEPEMGDEQRKRFMHEVLTRWAQYPQICGYWLILAGQGLEQRDVGHLYAFIQDYYGTPYVLLRQTECEKAWESREMFRAAKAEAGAWIEGLNAVQRANKQPVINTIQHWTVRDPEHDGEAWNRFLPELKQRKSFTVMVFDV